MRRGVAVVVTFVMLSSMLAPAVAAQTNETATAAPSPASDWNPPGPFDRADLTLGGVHDAEAPPSVRNIGEPISGSIGIRHSPPSPLKTQKDWAETGKTIENDRLQLYGTAYGDATGEYELVIVYWEDRTRKTENGTAVEYAANQSVQRITFNMSAGYNKVPIGLRSHYDDTKEMTMWLERDGERVDGARWQYRHRSNPLTAAPASDISSKGDLWRWGAVNILLPAVPGIFVGRKAAVHFLERTVTSPRKGTAWWLLLLGVLTLVMLIAATWQTAAVLSRAPYVAGLSIAVLSFVAILGVRDQDVEKAELNKKDLETVTSVSGDESKSARNEEILLRDIVRRDGQVFMPAKGIRPFLARYWADAASVDESELTTVNNTEGDVSKKYEIDPAADETLHHRPARLSFSPEIVTPREDDAEPPASTVDKLLSPLTRLNWSFLGAAVGGGAVMYFGLQAAFGVPSLAVAGAVLPGLVSGTRAKDGELSFEPAPYHFSEARAVLAHERATHREARTFEDLHEMLADVDFETVEQLSEVTEVIRDKFKKNIDESFDVTADDPSSEVQGVSDD